MMIGIGFFFWAFGVPSISFTLKPDNPISNYIPPGIPFVSREPEIKTATLLFVGDIMLSRKVGSLIAAYNDPGFPFVHISSTLRAADLTFGNLENPISNRGANQGSIYSFRANPKVTEGLQSSGFDVLSVANNHIFDWGREALVDTLDILRAHGIEPIGAGRNLVEANGPYIKKVGDAKIAFFARTPLYPKSLTATTSTPGVGKFDVSEMKQMISDSRKEVDLVVMSLHWGEEYKTHSNESQRQMAHEFIDAGAHLIIGHHPHVVQELEQYKGGWIIYSLGNFVFDQDFSKETMEGEMLEVTLRGTQIEKVTTIKIGISTSSQAFLRE